MKYILFYITLGSFYFLRQPQNTLERILYSVQFALKTEQQGSLS